MLKNEIVFLLVCAWIVLLLVLIPGLVRLSGLPGDLINPLMYLGGVLTLAILYSLNSFIPILRIFMNDQFDKKSIDYIKSILKEKEYYRKMNRAKPPGRDSDPNFAEVFCDISSYSINDQRKSLSHWISHTSIGHKPYGAVLLGIPGSGKSVTLQALLLSFSNSYYCCNAFPKFLIKKNTLKKIHNSRLLKCLFDKTWLFPAPQYLPFLLKLQNLEDILKKYNDQKTKGDVAEIEEDLLQPILKRIGFENGSKFKDSKFEKELNNGRIAFLCDGLDELANEELQYIVFDLIKHLWEQSSYENPHFFLISCRSDSYSETLRNKFIPAFHDIKLENLLPDDKREIVKRLLRCDYKWVNKQEKKSDLLWNLKNNNNKIPKDIRPTVEDIFADITMDIIVRIPQIYKKWNPTDFPLSLRRLTSVFLTKPMDILQPEKEVDPNLKRIKWKLEISSLFDYTELIKEDLEEFFKRRNSFADKNNYDTDRMMLLYGELAYKYDEINYDVVKKFVLPNLKIKNVDIDEMSSYFLLPGILTPAEMQGDQQKYVFRDPESANFLKAFYMYKSLDVAQKIDHFINTHNFRDEEMTFSMTFSKLSPDTLKNFVNNTKHYSDPQILYGLVSGVIGSKSFSLHEAEIFLLRSIRELEKNKEEDKSLKLWQLIRYICFSSNYPISSEDRQHLIDILKKGDILPLNRAQALLLLAELYFFKRIDLDKRWFEDTLKKELDNENVLVSSCSMLSMALVFPEKINEDNWRKYLTVSAPSGSYRLGNEYVPDNPPGPPLQISTFKIARFPVLRFEYSQWKEDENNKLKPGDAFKPVTRISITDAREYARSKGAEIPTADEFEVVTSYHGGDGQYREYPWGNSFTSDRKKIAFEEEGNLSIILYEDDKVMPVGLKPALANPAGIFDLVGNIYQLTSSEPHFLSPSGKYLLAFGAILDLKEPEYWKNYYRNPVLAENNNNKYLGFRLLSRWKESKEK